MMNYWQITTLVVVATLGHIMALFWHFAETSGFKICQSTIYAIPISREQIAREIRNSIHAPIHAVLLAIFLLLGCFRSTSWQSYVISLVLTFVLSEIWHYVSHRLFHIRVLHWIHAEHHRSHLSSAFTALSFSFTEKLVFSLGLLGLLAIVDRFYPLNFYGIAAWYIGYLIINSFSHANFEVKSRQFQDWAGKVFTSSTYHSLHHSRYTGNYGLGTRLLDRMFKTEWEDYEPLYDQITVEGKPLTKLRERAGAQDGVPAANRIKA